MRYSHSRLKNWGVRDGRGSFLDLVIRKARLIGEARLKDIAVERGRIVEVDDRVEAVGEREVDANGRLVSPGFVDAHMHLDKALLVHEAPNVSGTLPEAIEVMHRKKREFTVEGVKRRARRVAGMAVRNGTTVLRTQVDVDPIVGLTGLKALLEVRDEFSDLVDIQIAAFPQEGLVDSESERLLREAMRLGADVVGGRPDSDSDPSQHIDLAFSICRDFGVDLDVHVDESDDPKDLALEYYAEKTIRERYFGRAVAAHCCSLAAVDDGTAKRIIGKVKEAGISVVTLPSTNLYLQGRGDRQPVRRGITRVKGLLDAGVNVLYASDNVRDPFNPFGNADMLQLALILAHAAHMGGMDELETVFMMGTFGAAKAVGMMEDYGVEVGKKADLVILGAESPQEAIISQAERAYVIKNGRIVAKDGELLGRG